MWGNDSGPVWVKGKMRLLESILGVMVVLAALAFQLNFARAEEPDATSSPGAFVLSGKDDYVFHCASCHGLDGRGTGPEAETLKVKPANLVLLSKRNGGSFPQKRVFAVIDGREVVQAHGTRDMPVWGESFAPETTNAFDPCAS